MKIFQGLLDSFRRKKIRKLPALHQGKARFVQKYGNRYKFGVGSYGMPIIHDWDEGSSLEIGSYCSIASNVQIFLGGNHRAEWVTTFPFPAMVEETRSIENYGVSRGSVVIGSDVWLCSGCMILSGVTIGHGAIVAAGAVVSRDVEPYAVVAGNPARVIKWRFDEATRKALLKSAWWTWPETEIREISPLLCNTDITGFLEYASHRL